MRRIARARRFGFLLSTSVIAALGANNAAHAQSAAPVPLSRSPIDENGVNLATGQMELPTAELTIGTPGDGGLTYTGYIGSSSNVGYNFSLNSYAIAEAAGGGLVIGSSGKNFNGTTAIDGSGETYANGVYTMRDGTKVVITPLPAPPPSVGPSGPFYTPAYIYIGAGGTVQGLATKITYPNGEIINITYRIETVDASTIASPFHTWFKHIRIQSVTSNRGYQLKYSYASNTTPVPFGNPFPFGVVTGVTAINNVVDYCNPATDTCTGLTVSWPSLSIAASGSTTTVTDPLGRATAYTNDSSGRLAGIQRPSSPSNNVTIGYDANGRVASLTKDGVSFTYAFSLSGTVLTGVLTGPTGTIRTTTADTSTGAMLSVTDALSKTTSYQQDSFGRITKVTYPEGNYVTTIYDARGNATQTTATAKAGSGLADIVTSAGYDSVCYNTLTCNQPNWSKDANGYQTDYTYDPATGNPLTVTLPAPTGAAPIGSGTRPKTTYSYSGYQAYYKNSAGAIVASGTSISLPTSISRCQTGASCAGTADEAVTTIDYGPQTAGTPNNLLPVSSTARAGDNSVSATTASTYDNIGNQVTVDGPLPGADDTSYFRYDAARQRIGAISPDPDGAGPRKRAAQRIGYTALGQPNLVEAGTVNGTSDTDWANFTSLQQVASTYDVNGRKTQDAVTAGGTTYAVTQYSYDALGRPDCTAVRMNPAVFGSLPSSACSLGAAGSAGPDRITKLSYDAAGRASKATSGYGTADQADDATTTYTDNGQLATATDAENNKTSYTYDGFDRLLKTNYPSTTKGSGTSSTTDYEQLGYDANGNVTSRLLRGGTLTINYTYDNLNRLITKDLPGTEPDVTYGYDLLGRPTSAVTSAQSLSFTYDALGRKLSETGPFGTVNSRYDAAGRRTRLTWPDAFYVSYDYQVTGEMTTVKENGTTTLGTYGYDDLGRRASLTLNNGVVTTYSYDAISRLSSLTHDLAGTANDLILGFSYNPASQITSTTRSNNAYAWPGAANVARAYTSNGLNQYATAGSATFGYDAKGNLTSDGTTSYTYDSENRMVTTTFGSGATLVYDPLGRYYGSVQGSATKTVLYDGDQRIAEFDGATLSKRYVPGADEDNPLIWYEGSTLSDRRSLQADERGSIVSVADAAGILLSINSYDEYGIPWSQLGKYGFTGQVWIPQVGCWYYKARFYCPTIGRFMQSDPIGYGDGMNWYNYVGGDPVNGSDPTGTCNQKDAWTGCGDIPIYGTRIFPEDYSRYFTNPGSITSPGFVMGNSYVPTFFQSNPAPTPRKFTPGSGPPCLLGLRCKLKLWPSPCPTVSMTVTSYNDKGAGSDWAYWKNHPEGVGPGTVAVANTNPKPYAYGTRFNVLNSDGTSAYRGTALDTGAGWDANHHNVSPDQWIDIWLSGNAANKWGVQRRNVMICPATGGN